MSTEDWVDEIIDTPGITLGPRASYAMMNDPRRMAIVLSRYKFCAKMLSAKDRILDIGCGDGFGAPIVAQICDYWNGIDIDTKLIEGNKKRLSTLSKLNFEEMDITASSPSEKFDGAYSLDVIEHISLEEEVKYFQNICSSLKDDAICIIGTPNITSDKYASKPGHSPHINLKDEASFRESMNKYFKNVLIFSMNDEVVHTGFTPMAHYLFAVGIGVNGR